MIYVPGILLPIFPCRNFYDMAEISVICISGIEDLPDAGFIWKNDECKTYPDLYPGYGKKSNFCDMAEISAICLSGIEDLPDAGFIWKNDECKAYPDLYSGYGKK